MGGNIGDYKSTGWTDRLGPRGQYAAEEIYERYGDVVRPKFKSLNKFGRAALSSANVAYTVAFLGSTVANNEVLTTSNSIDSVVSDNTGDTQSLYLEGHTINSSGKLTFKSTTVTLSGTTPSTYAGFARVTRAYVNNGTFASPSSDNVGTIRFYDSSASTAVAAGVPAPPACLHAAIRAGRNQTEKAQTAISNKDYYILEDFGASLRRDSGAGTGSVTVRLEVRELGGVWRQRGREITCVSSGTNDVNVRFDPPQIVKPNSDVRITATPSTVDLDVTANFEGILVARTTQ